MMSRITRIRSTFPPVCRSCVHLTPVLRRWMLILPCPFRNKLHTTGSNTPAKSFIPSTFPSISDPNVKFTSVSRSVNFNFRSLCQFLPPSAFKFPTPKSVFPPSCYSINFRSLCQFLHSLISSTSPISDPYVNFSLHLSLSTSFSISDACSNFFSIYHSVNFSFNFRWLCQFLLSHSVNFCLKFRSLSQFVLRLILSTSLNFSILPSKSSSLIPSTSPSIS